MKFRRSIRVNAIAVTAIAAALLSACVSMPDFDRSADVPPEFQEEFGEQGRIPFNSDVPAAPRDVKSSGQWDLDANAILKLRDEFDRIERIPASTPQQIIAKQAQLHARVNEYKLDDPE